MLDIKNQLDTEEEGADVGAVEEPETPEDTNETPDTAEEDSEEETTSDEE
jgi:hypothetical protein